MHELNNDILQTGRLKGFKRILIEQSIVKWESVRVDAVQKWVREVQVVKTKKKIGTRKQRTGKRNEFKNSF